VLDWWSEGLEESKSASVSGQERSENCVSSGRSVDVCVMFGVVSSLRWNVGGFLVLNDGSAMVLCGNGDEDCCVSESEDDMLLSLFVMPALEARLAETLPRKALLVGVFNVLFREEIAFILKLT